MATKRKSKSSKGFDEQSDLFTQPAIPPQPADAVELVERNLLDYALYVIGDRAVPSVADGLKPVARRLLWGALNGAPPAIPGRPTVKCARVTGETMAKYHPHGDSYLALVRMAQPFAMRAPLFEFQGNYGSPDFGPAASRYTETRLSEVAMALLAEVRDGTVDLVPNYDGLEVEPEVLPAGFPNLFVNGSYGIAFGMASHFPTHNPVEVCNAAKHLIENPNATVDELLEIVPGPDYPDPCTVVNGDELAGIYRSGTGQIRVRGMWIVEETKRGQRVIITSLPYVNGSTGSSEEFIRGVVSAVEEGKLAGIDDVVNESAKGDTRIAIDLAKGIEPTQVIPGLLRFTNLQVTNPVRMHALDTRGIPQMYNLRTALESWIAHRVDVVERRSRKRIEVISDRLHLLDGLLLVLLDIDAAIAIIRGSDDAASARTGLMAHFGIDEIQANYVLDLTLRRLTRLARVELEKEQTTLRRELQRLQALVESPRRLRRQVGSELDEVAKMFEGIERHTEITTAALPSAVVAIPDEPMELVVLDTGYVQAFKATAKVRAPKEGVVIHRIASSTATHIVTVTEQGQLFRSIGAGFPTDKPTAFVNVLQGVEGAKVLHWASNDSFASDLLLVTSQGTIKRMVADDLAGGDRKGGISIIKLDAGEKIVALLPFSEDVPVLIATAKGQAIRFVPSDVRPMGRTAAGVRGIKLLPGDTVAGAVNAPDEGEVVLVHSKGMAKRLRGNDFPLQGRAGKGVKLAAGGRHGDITIVAPVIPLLARLADNTVVEFPAQTAVYAARDAPPAKIRGFEGIAVELLPAPEG
jgi:DNA gyrase subunit A